MTSYIPPEDAGAPDRLSFLTEALEAYRRNPSQLKMVGEVLERCADLVDELANELEGESRARAIGLAFKIRCGDL